MHSRSIGVATICLITGVLEIFSIYHESTQKKSISYKTAKIFADTCVLGLAAVLSIKTFDCLLPNRSFGWANITFLVGEILFALSFSISNKLKSGSIQESLAVGGLSYGGATAAAFITAFVASRILKE